MLSVRTSSLLRRAAAGTLVAGFATAGLAVGTAGAEDTARPTGQQSPAVTQLNPEGGQPLPIAAVQSDQFRTLRVLRRDRRSSDAVPLDAMPAVGPQRFGRNPLLARAVSGPNGKGWVVPGDGVVCLVVQDPVDGYGSTCERTDVVARKGLTLGAISATSATATTLTPDGAVVTAQGEDGTDRVVTPDGAGIVTVDAEKTDVLEVETDAGPTETPVYDQKDLESGAVR